MKIAILGSKHLGMNELIKDSLFKIDGVDKSTEIVIMEEANLRPETFDSIICVSIYDLANFETMIECNSKSKCNMIISGAVFEDGTTRGHIKQSDYHNSILWREKFEYKKALEEVIEQLKK